MSLPGRADKEYKDGVLGKENERARWRKCEEERRVPYMSHRSSVQSDVGSVLVEVSLDHTHSLLHPHSSQTPILSSPKQALGRK